MKAFWTLASDLEKGHQIDVERCRRVVAQSGSIADVRTYIEDVLSRLNQGDRAAVGEAWSVAVPLAYRLSIDDTASGYRIASRLKDSAMRVAYPEFMAGVELEIDWLCKSAYGVDYSELRRVQDDIRDELASFSRFLEGSWHVYGRRKCIASIYEKLCMVRAGDKSPKNDSAAVLDRIASLLNQFQGQVLQRLSGDHRAKRGYDFGDVKWLLPDLLAFTLQLAEDDVATRNLGSAKNKYQGVFRALGERLPAHVFFGPSYSTAWHMNRMVCHLEYPVGQNANVAIELFVRTDFDFFIGYGSYWRYKGVDLFAASSQEDGTARQQFIRRVRACRRFSDVQEMLFAEIRMGQLSLF